ncbi:MAG TPA: 16S rRNA (guanine(527)-N(7))-methyltransferase RsmG [Candidatus Saccharimonadales bacterium]
MDAFLQLFEKYKFALNIAQQEKLEQFVELFQAYNARTNLSAIRDPEGIWLKHIADSLMPVNFEPFAGKLLDIGSGGGLPGIPLAIACPNVDITLLDSVGKKVKACEHFIDKLGLHNIHVIQGRAERLDQQHKFQNHFDIVTSRATAYLPTILAWSEQFIKNDGRIILYKTASSGELDDGAAAAKYLGLKLLHMHYYHLDGQERQILVYIHKASSKK